MHFWRRKASLIADDDDDEDDDIGHIKSFPAPGPGYDVEDEESLCFANHQNQSLNNILQALEPVINLIEFPHPSPSSSSSAPSSP